MGILDVLVVHVAPGANDIEQANGGTGMLWRARKRCRVLFTTMQILR